MLKKIPWTALIALPFAPNVACALSELPPSTTAPASSNPASASDSNALIALRALAQACEKGDWKEIENAILKGAPVNARYGDVENTPLIIASAQPETLALQALIKHGADLRLTNKFGVTPLHAAAIAGHDLNIVWLIRSGAEVEARAHGLTGNLTPLHVAVSQGNPKATAALLLSGADVNARTAESKTSLHIAVASRNKVIVSMLLEAGAAILPDTQGKTPVDICRDVDDQHILDMLLNFKPTTQSVKSSD